MCVVSMIMGDAANWPPSRWEKKDWRDHFEEMMRIAREYDKKTNQPDCEDTDKKRIIQEIADKLGVKINFGDKE